MFCFRISNFFNVLLDFVFISHKRCVGKRTLHSLRKIIILLSNIYLIEAGLTQEKLAELMGTKKSNISRLESFKSNISARVETLKKYARTTGYELRVDFVYDVLILFQDKK